MFATLLLLIVFMRFGGFSTGEAANVDELQEYALPIETLSIPEEKKIIALGEATHGNVEFQRLKLEVFKKLLEERGVTLLSAGIDEVPGVYKDIDRVMAAQAELVEPLARFDPRIVKMAGPGEQPED